MHIGQRVISAAHTKLFHPAAARLMKQKYVIKAPLMLRFSKNIISTICGDILGRAYVFERLNVVYWAHNARLSVGLTNFLL